MNTTTATRNERWSAGTGTTIMVNDNFQDTCAPIKRKSVGTTRSSAHLRQILCRQDFAELGMMLDGSLSPTLIRPSRRISADSLSSRSSTMSSMSSMSSKGSFVSITSRYDPTRKSSRGSFLRYKHVGSTNNSLGSFNSRWKSIPTKKRTTVFSQTITPSMIDPITKENHQRRWLATLASDRAIDQPIGMVQRKKSSSCLFSSSA